MTNWYTCTISWFSQSCQSVILTRIINALWTRMTLILLQINFYGSFAGSKLLVLHPCGFHLNVWGPFRGRGGDICPNIVLNFKTLYFKDWERGFVLVGILQSIVIVFSMALGHVTVATHFDVICQHFDAVLRCYFKVISPQIFSSTGPHFCNIYIYLIFKMGKWPVSLTNMIIVAISLFSLNIFLNCFIGPMRKQVL